MKGRPSELNRPDARASGTGAILWDEAAIQARIRELGAEVARHYRATLGDALAGSPPIAVGLLRGAFVFMADLIRALPIPIECDFVHLSSYGRRSEPGELEFLKDLETPIEGRHVLIVEDIVDTGGTLAYLRECFGRRNPASLKVCAFIDKRARRRSQVDLDYVGFTLERDAFVVGYGLDYAGLYRNLPYITTLKPEAFRPS